MNLLFDMMLILFSLLLQIACGSSVFSGFPFVLCAVLVLAMRRNAVAAVVVSLVCGFLTDVVCGREFACSTISFPIAAVVGYMLLPEEPLRFFFGDYILGGCAAVFVSGILQTVTPLFFGKEWYYLAQGGCETVLSTVAAAGIFPFFVFACDRIACKLEIRRVFTRTIKFALRPARR